VQSRTRGNIAQKNQFLMEAAGNSGSISLFPREHGLEIYVIVGSRKRNWLRFRLREAGLPDGIF
jgi:hypothetical protein